MTIIGVKSIPLERSTNIAWKTVPNFWFIARERGWHSVLRHINSRTYQAVLNLGAIDLDTDAIRTTVFNKVQTIKAISLPSALRRTLEEFIPEQTTTHPHWHKSGGFGGRGNYFCDGRCPAHVRGDIQRHIDGTEYRIISVGNSVVQASRKSDRRTRRNGRNEFVYSWIGIEGIRKGGFIPFIKEAIKEIPHGDTSVLGWDVLHDGDKPWIIEANTCPGVNSHTATRIIEKIKELS